MPNLLVQIRTLESRPAPKTHQRLEPRRVRRQKARDAKTVSFKK